MYFTFGRFAIHRGGLVNTLYWAVRERWWILNELKLLVLIEFKKSLLWCAEFCFICTEYIHHMKYFVFLNTFRYRNQTFEPSILLNYSLRFCGILVYHPHPEHHAAKSHSRTITPHLLFLNSNVSVYWFILEPTDGSDKSGNAKKVKDVSINLLSFEIFILRALSCK